MRIFRVLGGLSILLLTGITACSDIDISSTATPSPAPQLSTPILEITPVSVISEATDDPNCPLLVREALQRVDTACAPTGRNQVCYGNNLVNAEPQAITENLVFENPGDIVLFSDIRSLQLSPVDTLNSRWGITLMRLQANVPDTLPGQNVTFLLFGNTELDNTANDAQSFYFTSNFDDVRCQETPSSGLLIQTPPNSGRVTFRVNGVDFQFAATLYLQAPPDGDLTVNVIEGDAQVIAQGESQTVTAGNQTTVQLDDQRNPSAPPSEPQPYQSDNLITLPVYNLQRPVNIAKTSLESTFRVDDEGWTAAGDGATLSYLPADTTLDGSICVQNENGASDLTAPETWSGDYRVLYSGNLNLNLRQTRNNQQESAPSVILASSVMSIIYEGDPNLSGEWTTISIPLDETAGWRVTDTDGAATDTAPTQVQMETVLGNLTALHIRVSSSTCLDGVQFIQQRSPTAPDVRSGAAFVEPTAVNRIQSEATQIPIGQPVNSTLDQIGEVDVYTFTATAGEEVYFAALGTENNVEWRVEDSAGAVLFDRAGLWLGNDPGMFTLTAGDYTIYVQGETDNIGDYNFFIWDVPPPQTFTLKNWQVDVDDPQTGVGVIGLPGEQDIYTFTIDREQSVLFLSGGREDNDIGWSVSAQDGDALFENKGLWQGNDFGPFTLVPGTYTITVSGNHGDTGSYRFSFYEVLEPQTFTVALGDTVSEGSHGRGSGNIEASGSSDVYSLTINSPQDVLFVVLGNEDNLDWKVEDPNGDNLFENEGLWQGNQLGPFTLSRGTYTVIVTTDRGTTGRYSFEVRPVDS